MLTQVHDQFLQPLLEYLIFVCDVEIVQELLLAPDGVVLPVADEYLGGFDLLVDVELLPEHGGVLHC